MKVSENFESNCYHIRGYALLTSGPKLESALGATLAAQVLKDLREGASLAALPELLGAGSGGTNTFGASLRRDSLAARVKELVAQAEASAGSGAGAAQLLKAIKRRAADWGAELAAGGRSEEAAREVARAVGASGEEDGNPYVAALANAAAVERAVELEQAASAGAREANARTLALEEELGREVERLRRQDERLAQFGRDEADDAAALQADAPKSTPKRWKLPLAVGLGFFVFAAILGVSVLTATAAGVAAGGLMAVVAWRAAKAPAPAAQGTDASAQTAVGTQPTRRLSAALRAKFLAYGSALEGAAVLGAEAAFAARLQREFGASASRGNTRADGVLLGEAEEALRQASESVPEGFFQEVDPGHVELLGRELVSLLAEEALTSGGAADLSARALSAFARMQGVTFAEHLRAGDGRSSAAALVDAVNDTRPGLTLAGVLARLDKSAKGQRFLTHRLDALAGAACSALALGQEVRIDPSLSVVRLTVGLPEGERDPLVPLFRERLPHAGVTHGSMPDAIEFVFDVRNLPAAALITHELSRTHYDAANPWEREKLWHYPKSKTRRLSVSEEAGGFTPEARQTLRTQVAAPRNGNGHGASNGRHKELIFPGDVV
jgi:hypothetical protein